MMFLKNREIRIASWKRLRNFNEKVSGKLKNSSDEVYVLKRGILDRFGRSL
jgi:hypothetical protein